MLVLLAILGCTPDEEPDPGPPPERVAPDQTGPYAVGVTTLVLDDPRGGTVNVEVWYPALDPGTPVPDYPEFAISRDAHRDAELDVRGAPYPLVAFSHGFGGIRYQNAYMVEHLAAHGFAVVAPDHRDNTMLDLKSSLTGQVLVDRPGEVIRAVDGLLADPQLGPHVDGNQYLMSGHSFGGLTTLAVTGAVPDFDFGLDFCETHEDAPPGCAFFDDTEVGDPALMQPDPRAVAGVDISPGGWYAFGESGMTGVAPILAFAGTLDADLPYDEEAVPTMARMPEPRGLVSLQRTGHWGVTDICLILSFLEDCGADDTWMTPDRAQGVIKTMVTAFAVETLTDDEQDSSWLSEEGWPGEDVVFGVPEP